MRKKDPHLDPFIKLTGKEETQQKPADTAEEASEVFFARRSSTCIVPGSNKTMAMRKEFKAPGFPNPPPAKGFNA